MIRHRLQRKVLTVILILTLIPLVMLTVYSIYNLNEIEQYFRQNAAEALDKQAAKALVLRARTVAADVADFLENTENNLKTLAMLPTDEQTYIEFYNRHKKLLWYEKSGNEIKEQIPLYKEITFFDLKGNELIRITDGKINNSLRDISDIKNTTYKTENYFSETAKLKKGEIYTSRVTGWHSLKKDKHYEGVIRFATPVFRDGIKTGYCMLSLDHRHLMEYTAHITSTEESFSISPSYENGNYAFIFDDEGWIVAHPKHWDIRGFDKDGKLVPPYTSSSSKKDIKSGKIPYNLMHAQFIHRNYPVAARAVFYKQFGVVDVTNVGGSKKIMAYAPILYNTGIYKDKGIFGGVTIGAQVEQFHKPAIEISDVIKKGVKSFVLRSWLFVLITITVVIFVGYRLSDGITKPLISLTDRTKEMAKGNFPTKVSVESVDEVGQLADSFNIMARELETRSNNLKKTIEKLNHSNEIITNERNFKTVLFENIETGILTIDKENRVTSINNPAKVILDTTDIKINTPMKELFINCPEMLKEIEQHIEGDLDKKWSDYVKTVQDGIDKTFRIALLPLSKGSIYGRIITIEDITERVNMRNQVERMRRLASMGRLSAGIAHEIRNPLTGISIMLDDLHDRLISQPDDRSLIQRSLQEIERLENLVNELLDFAVVKESSLKKINIKSLLEDTLVFINKQCERAGISLKTYYDDVPDVLGDSAKLKQSLLNLLTNAIDAMEGGGNLTVNLKYVDNNILISISDTGKGIDPEKLQLIFEPFYTDKGEGAGLGLSITYNIITEHGGTITVDSTPNKGSKFTINLPVA